jgi:transmembrane sensor
MSQNRFWNLLGKKLSGEALPDELRELEQLMKDYPDLVFSISHIEELWRQGAKTTDDYDAELAFEMHLTKLKAVGVDMPELQTSVSISEFSADDDQPSFRRKIIAFSIVACLLVAIALAWPHKSNKSDEAFTIKKFSEVSSPLGSKTKLVLPDSTVVWLNAGSKLTYSENFGSANRNTILSGEAFFDVRKSTVPFVIHANGVQIKVLGTAFNVKSYPNEKTTETSLVRGRVEITLDRRPGEKFILKPNEKLVVANEPEETKHVAEKKQEPLVILSGLTHTIKDEIVETSWVENKLIFQDESFTELAQKMERWYAVRIQIKNEKIANERLTGTFTTETVQAALEELQMITPFHFTIKSNSIEITR